MITIDQLLESVDLDFEPRWVTKDPSGAIAIWAEKPERTAKHRVWIGQTDFVVIHRIKLAEFENKDWQECIYEVPRNDVDYKKIKLGMEETGKQLDKISAQLDTIRDLMVKRGLIKVDAVNELKGAK